MISIDTNILLYAINSDSPFFRKAFDFLLEMGQRKNVILSEFVLIEFYGGLRNPKVMKNPRSAAEAAIIVQTYRTNDNWRITGYSDDSRGLHDRLWKMVARANYPRRKIFDDRLAFTLQRHGVTEFATANVKDFKNCGFEKVFSPL